MSVINLPSQTELSGFYVIYKGSTNLERKGIYGISHLMEHLVCKSLDPYQDELDMLGISHNAYTSNNEIVFHITGLDESLSKWRTKFLDLLGEFNVTKEEFENERNIVLQEYTDSFNDQMSNHWLNLDRKIFGNYNPIGLREDLENLTWMDCLNFFEEQYMYPSMIINVSKNIEFGTDIEFKTPDQNKTYKRGKYPTIIQRENDYNNKVSLIMSSDIVSEHFPHIKIINKMLSSGLQSPLYQEIREKRGLVYFVGSSFNRLNDQGYNSIYTMSSEDNISKIVSIVDTIFKNPTKFLTKERFEVVKQSLIISYKKQEINRHSSIDKWINPDGFSMSDIIEDVTYDEIMDVAKSHFKLDNYYISRDDKEFN